MKLTRIVLFLVVLVTTVPLGFAAETATDEVNGHWRAISVEYAGQKIEAFVGAKLQLKNGEKLFTLPSGDVERGTYKLDTGKSPKRMDATTEGRDAVALGIYEISDGALRMCFSQSGTRRPTRFATETGTDQLLIVCERSAEPDSPERTRKPIEPPPRLKSTESGGPARQIDGPRRFRMGFTGFVPDTTTDAVVASRRFVKTHGDILAHHIEGVPWAEVLAGEGLPKTLLDDWTGRKSATPEKGEVYLAVSPGRGELKVCEKGQPLPASLRGKTYADPVVQRTYLEYCRLAIDFFDPDYLAIGIEVNEIHSTSKSRWNAYVGLHRYVYSELKKRHPALPIFASFSLHNLYKERGEMLDDFRRLMPQNDLVAVSYYPFFLPDPVRLTALTWMAEQFDAFDKPYAIVETNDNAETLNLPQSKIVIPGDPAKQQAYYEWLLALAQERGFEFVISFIHQDYDALWDRIAAQSPELFMCWRDCGLLDQEGKPRPVLATWNRYFKQPFERD